MGGGNPETNIRLRTAIADTKTVSLPKKNIDRARAMPAYWRRSKRRAKRRQRIFRWAMVQSWIQMSSQTRWFYIRARRRSADVLSRPEGFSGVQKSA